MSLKFSGPLEEGEWPNQIRARVVTPGPHPCVHGYDVENDLARRHTPTDLLFLALTGELPTTSQSEGLRVASLFLAPLSVAHAPTHAAVLARLCGGPASNIISVAATALAEQAGEIVQEHGVLLNWLNHPTDELPLPLRAASESDFKTVQALRSALGTQATEVPAWSLDPTPLAAAFCLLFWSGLKTAWFWQTILVHSRLPIVLAEAFAEKSGNFRRYPINLPRYVYETVDDH